ncbi:unnamed protein product [Dovyalis caffra]|uniref:Uncharacterized protein n=1 Tax=Dovyalis caffra TaxID=77055 RepID=A0AAV1SQ39_9ROSI|nr:unnamed protein product [Dovyalis caffra]
METNYCVALGHLSKLLAGIIRVDRALDSPNAAQGDLISISRSLLFCSESGRRRWLSRQILTDFE